MPSIVITSPTLKLPVSAKLAVCLTLAAAVRDSGAVLIGYRHLRDAMRAM